MKLPIHYLTFADTTGLDARVFNTLRLGGGWEKRLLGMERVLLTTKYQVIGRARISMIMSGHKDHILQMYAASNHLELAMAAEQGVAYDRAGAPARRLQSMIKNYGPRSVEGTSRATVIFLKPY